MGKIHVLDSKTYNKIAAGEVVERPCSVVKELVENSIDAGSTDITVEIENGGISLIKIIDNGSGIEKDDLKNALTAHATSKIEDINDIESVLTLGFRGEALSSIASVSRLKIVSATAEENGSYIYTEGGMNTEIGDSPCVKGTEVTVDDLFFNVPARRKFLKTERAEEAEITNIVTRMILGYPAISFRYIVDGKVAMQSFGDGFENAMVAVYGAKVIDDCFYVDEIKNGIRVNGYLGKHYFTKGKRTYQTLFVNGRYVINNTASTAIANAYAGYLMKRQYPFYVLKITLPPEVVDVNVHPQKSDVRFSDNRIVYSALYSVASHVLDGTNEALDIINTGSEVKVDTDFKIDGEDYKLTKDGELLKKDLAETAAPPINADKESKADSDDIILFDKNYDTTGTAASEFFDKKEEEFKKESKAAEDIFAENKAYLESLERKKTMIENATKSESDFAKEIAASYKETFTQDKIKTDVTLTKIGQALKTYLILEDGENLYFIDQHAAHERILYDRLVKRSENEKSKMNLLVPYTMTLSSLEAMFLERKLKYIEELGIEIEEFGTNTFRVTALPLELTDLDLKDFFDDVMGDMTNLSDDKLPEVIKDRLAQKACKAAIKAGYSLSESEIDALLNDMKGNLGLKCPHGRPVVIKITRAEIDKWFKRIV